MYIHSVSKIYFFWICKILLEQKISKLDLDCNDTSLCRNAPIPCAEPSTLGRPLQTTAVIQKACFLDICIHVCNCLYIYVYDLSIYKTHMRFRHAHVRQGPSRSSHASNIDFSLFFPYSL